MSDSPEQPDLDPEKVKDQDKSESEAEEEEAPRPARRRSNRAPASPGEESFAIQFGSNLYPLNQPMIRQILWLGKNLFARNGLLLPPLQLTPNPNQSANLYTVHFLAQEVGRFAVPHQAFLVLGEEQELRKIEPNAALNPHPLTFERMVWVFSGAIHRVFQHDLFAISHLEFLAYFTNWLFHKNYVAFFTVQRCQQSILALTEHVPTLAPLRGFFLKEVNNIWRLCLELLRKRGSMRNLPRILREYHQQRTQEPQQSLVDAYKVLLKRLSKHPDEREESPADLSSPEFRRLASGLIYMHASQAGWSEQLANRLTEAEINQLLETLVDIAGVTPGAKVPLTLEVISRLDAVFMGRTPQDYFEFLRQLLDGRPVDTAPLNAVDRLALLILSLPQGCAPNPEDMEFLRAAEKKTLLGRIAFLTFHHYYGTFDHGPPTKHLMDIRDQVLVDFLDFVAFRQRPGWHVPTDSLQTLINQWAHQSPERFAVMCLRYYFHGLDPWTRLAEAARTCPRRVHRALREYFLECARSGQESQRVAPWRRGAQLLSALNEENSLKISYLLEAQGAWLRPVEPAGPEQQQAVMQEFAQRFWPYRKQVDVTACWQ